MSDLLPSHMEASPHIELRKREPSGEPSGNPPDHQLSRYFVECR
jgi:hypothetical protein